jgi:hypothetical protein
MTPLECKAQSLRIEKYRILESAYNEASAALHSITDTQASGQSPFTGNTRESRRVESIHIEFSPTRGGAPAASIDLYSLGIGALECEQAICGMLQKRLESISAEMEKI